MFKKYISTEKAVSNSNKLKFINLNLIIRALVSADNLKPLKFKFKKQNKNKCVDNYVGKRVGKYALFLKQRLNIWINFKRDLKTNLLITSAFIEYL